MVLTSGEPRVLHATVDGNIIRLAHSSSARRFVSPESRVIAADVIDDN